LAFPQFYNDMLRRLKEKVLAGKLNGNRADFWWKIRSTPGLGLISRGDYGNEDLPELTVTVEGAKEFLSSK
jgi:hypothetical protein